MEQKKSRFMIWKIIIFAISTAVVVRFLVIGIYKVPTSSMLPNLYVGDVILAWKLPFKPVTGHLIDFLGGKAKKLSRGDMIVFKHPRSGAFYIKRIIGLPGDHLKISKEGIEINGKALSLLEVEGANDYQGHLYYRNIQESLGEYKAKILRRLDEENQNKFQADLVVPIRTYFVLGDNRDSSDDSRDWGVVPEGNVEGLAKRVVLSFDWQSDEGASLRENRFWLPIE